MKVRIDELYLHDIAKSCRKIAGYLDGVTEDEFKSKELLQDAVVRNIEIIGEASKVVSLEIREQNTEITWKEIMRMRDKIAHHYFKLDIDVIWQTASEDIPILRLQIESILEASTD